MARYYHKDDAAPHKDPFDETGEDGERPSAFAQLLDAEVLTPQGRRYRPWESVGGTVVHVGKEYVLVDLGGKASGALARGEWGDLPAPKVGDSLEAYVREDNGSEIVLTRSLRREDVGSEVLREAWASALPVEAKVEKVVKGGFEVSVAGQRGFVPSSQIDLHPLPDPQQYVGSVFRFQVTKYGRGGRDLVLGRRGLLVEEARERALEATRALAPGQSLQATITRIAEFGAFADIGGAEGLIPLGELSRERVRSASHVVKVGDTVQVRVLRVEHAPRLRISLSLKEGGEDPWMGQATRLTPGAKVQGKVTRFGEGGAYVEVAPGVEGLVHMNHLAWHRVGSPGEVVRVGDMAEVTVLSLDLGARRLSLSLKGPPPAGAMPSSDPAEAAQWETLRKAAAAQGSGESSLAAAFARAKQRQGSKSG